jgi:putative ABC transport system ATP-binding protein
VIEIQGLKVIKNGKTILSDIDLKISRGEKILIRGESGSGKSTLIKSILFFEIFSGHISFQKKKVNEDNLREFRRNIGYIGQIVPHLNLKIREFLKLPFHYKSNREIKFNPEGMGEMLRGLNFDDSLLDKDFNDLSGGEKQRILILQVLLLKKPVYFFDEVTASLDRKNISRAIKTITNDRKRTIISISHNREWEKYCDRIIEMKKGKIIKEQVLA